CSSASLRTTGDVRPERPEPLSDFATACAGDAGAALESGGGEGMVAPDDGPADGVEEGASAAPGSISQRGLPTFTVAPSATRIFTILPDWVAGTSVSALSVATETTGCSRATAS